MRKWKAYKNRSRFEEYYKESTDIVIRVKFEEYYKESTDIVIRTKELNISKEHILNELEFEDYEDD